MVDAGGSLLVRALLYMQKGGSKTCFTRAVRARGTDLINPIPRTKTHARTHNVCYKE